MLSEVGLIRIVLAIIVGVLFGIVYTMRVMVLMDRRIARIELHIERLVAKVLAGEQKIMSRLGIKRAAKIVRKKPKKKVKKKKVKKRRRR